MKELKVVSAELTIVEDKNLVIPESLNGALSKLQKEYRLHQVLDIKVFGEKVNALVLVEKI
jgi:hypothetical protein